MAEVVITVRAVDETGGVLDELQGRAAAVQATNSAAMESAGAAAASIGAIGATAQDVRMRMEQAQTEAPAGVSVMGGSPEGEPAAAWTPPIIAGPEEMSERSRAMWADNGILAREGESAAALGETSAMNWGAVQKQTEGFEALDASMDDTAEAAGAMGAAMASAGEKSSGFFNLSNPWVKLMVGGAIAKGVWGAGKAAVDFSQDMNYVGTELGGNSKEIRRFHDELMNLAEPLGRKLPDLAQGLYQTLAEGVSPSNAIEFLKISSNLATAGNAPLGQVTSLLGGAMHAYHMNMSEVASYADLLATAVHHSHLQVSDLNGDLSALLPVTDALHIPMQQVTASIMTLANAGFPASTAIQGLREFVLDLVKEEKKFKQANIDIVGDLQKGGFTAAFEDLQKLTGGHIAQMKEFVPNIRAITPALSLLSKDAAEFAHNLDILAKSEGEASHQAQEMLSNLGGAAKKAGGEWSVFKTEIGEALPTGAFIELGDAAMQGLGDVLKAISEAENAWDKFYADITGAGSGSIGSALGNIGMGIVHAVDSLVPLHQQLEELPDAVINFFGSGSATLPISQKISEISTNLQTLGGTTEHVIDFQSSGMGTSGGISSGIADLLKLEGQYGTDALLEQQYGEGIGAARSLNFDQSMEAQIGSLISYQMGVNAGVPAMYGASNYPEYGTAYTATPPAQTAPLTVQMQIHGITINGGNLNDATDVGAQIETAIASNIQRNASPINTALKEAGFQTQ